MRFPETAVLWLHILLPAISLMLLSPTAVLALAKAQQQQAKVLSNFMNLKSKAALAAARAKHHKFYSRLSNRVGKLHALRNERIKRQALFEGENGVSMMDGTQNFAANIPQFQFEQSQTLQMPQQSTGLNTNFPNIQEKDMDRKEEVIVGLQPDQQQEALSQLENMWNMNSFPSDQASGDLIRSSEPGVLESPEPHFFAHAPKAHSKAISLVKDKKGGTAFSFASYDQWRAAQENGENGQGGMVHKVEPKEATSQENRDWMKEKNEEAKFNAAIKQLFNARHPHNSTIDNMDTNLGPIFTVPPPTSTTLKPRTTTLSASDLWNIQESKDQEESNKMFEAIQRVINKRNVAKAEEMYLNKYPERRQPSRALPLKIFRATSIPKKKCPPRKYQFNSTNDPSLPKSERETQAKPTTSVAEGIVQQGTPNNFVKSENRDIEDPIMEMQARENPDQIDKIFQEIQEHNMRIEFEKKMLNFTKGHGIRRPTEQQQIPTEPPSEIMNPQARTFDMDSYESEYEDSYDFGKKLCKIIEKKVKLLTKKLKIKDKDDYSYPESYYSTHSGYENGNSGYYRNAEENNDFDENPAETAMLTRELEEENRNFPGHDPNHAGHIDGRCADIDDKLYKIYKKKLNKLYKKLYKKKPYSVPVVYPIYNNQQHDNYGQYGNEQYGDGHYVNGGYNDAYGGGSGYFDYNRNAGKDDKQNSKKQKSAVENSTENDPKSSAFNPTNIEKSSVILSHPFARVVEKTEDSFLEDPKTRHFKGSFSHGHSIQFNKEFGLGPVHPNPPAPVQINLNANSFANAGSSANAASFQQQQSSASANSFASSGSHQNYNQQAGSFGGAAGESIPVHPSFIDQQSTNSFANAGSQQSSFLNRQQEKIGGFSNSHGGGLQFSAQPAQVWENRPDQDGFQNGWNAGQSGVQNNFQQGFSQGGSAQSNAQASSKNFHQGFSNGFNEGASGSSAQSFAKAQSNSFSQSPVTFGLGGNTHSFASASASAGTGGAPWVGEGAPIPVEEFMNDGESLIPVTKTARQLSFITNIVDQSLKLGEQVNQNEFSDDSIKLVDGIVDQSVSPGGSNIVASIPLERESNQVDQNLDLNAKKKSVFDTMNFVTGIVDSGINEHEKHKPRKLAATGSPVTSLLTNGLRLKRHAELPIDQNEPPMNLQDFEIIRREMDHMRESQLLPNFFINQESQDIPQQNFMPHTFPQMQERSHFPTMVQQQSNHQPLQNLQENNIKEQPQEIKKSNFKKAQEDVIKAFTHVNDQATHLADNITHQKSMENIQQPKLDLDFQQLDTVKHKIKKAQKEIVGAFNDVNMQALQTIQAVKEKEQKEKESMTPLFKHLREDDNDDDSSEEKMKTERTPRITIQPISTTENIASLSINKADTKNASVSKLIMSELFQKTGIAGILKNIDDELNMLTPAQRQEFVTQELDLLTEMVVESLKKNDTKLMMHNVVNTTLHHQLPQPNQVKTAKDPIVSKPYLFQAPNNLARESFYNRPEYRSADNGVDDSRLGIKHLEDNFDSILGMHQDTVQDLKRLAQDDNNLLMISWIGEGLVKDLQERRDKSTRRKREVNFLKSDPVSLTNLVSDSNAKIDVTKTLDNLGAVTRHVLENTKAPMYHVRSLLGNAKNSVMAAVKAAPNNLIIPSKYEISNVENDRKLGSINRKLLKEKIIKVAEERKSGNKKAEGFGITDTFDKLRSILKESVDSGKQSVAHANDIATDARNVLYTARHSVPQILTPLHHLAGAPKLLGNPLPKKSVLLAPRILDVTDNNNLLNNAEPETEDKFVGLGQILDSVGLTNPNKNDIKVERIVLQPETVEILRNFNKGRPKEITSSSAIKEWLKDSYKADQITLEARNYLKENLLGNSIDATLESLEETKNDFGAKNLKELINDMRLQMKAAVKEHLNFITRKRKMMKRAKILMKYKGRPVQKESAVGINDIHNKADTFVPNIIKSRMNDPSHIPNKMGEENVGVQEPAANMIQTHDFPVSTTIPLVTTEKILSQSNAISTLENNMQDFTKSTHNNFESNVDTTELPEDPNNNLGLYLTPDLMKPFMGRASTNELNQFWRENNDLEDITPNKNTVTATNQISQSTVSTLPLFFPKVTTAKTPNKAQVHQEFDNQALTQMLGATNPIMFERFFNDRLQANSITENHDRKIDSNLVSTPKHLEPQKPDLNDMHIKNQETLPALSHTGIQSMKTQNKDTTLTTNGFSSLVRGRHFDNERATESSSQVEATKENFHKFETRVPETSVLDPLENISSENSEDNKKARFDMVPEDELYKKPFMGTLDKKLIKKFLKKYNNIPDSSSEEEDHITPYKQDIYSSIGYENEIY